MPLRNSPYRQRQDALAALGKLFQEWTGQAAPLLAFQEPDAEADAILDTSGASFLVDVEQRADAVTIEHVLARAAQARERDQAKQYLLLVPYMTEAGRARCEKGDLSWADLSGNARIRARHEGAVLYVHVEGRPNLFPTRGRPRNAFAPKASRLARLLMAEPGRARTQSEIADEAQLDPGYTSRLVKTLLKADLLVRLKDGTVQIDDPELFLEAWAESNAYRHECIEGHLPGRSGEERAHRLQDILEAAGADFAFTGLAAAWAYTRAASFRSVSCYLSRVPHEALAEAGFRMHTDASNVRLLIPDDEGVFQGTRTVAGLRVVAPAQVFVDLRHEPERAGEMASALQPIALAPSSLAQPDTA